MNPSTLIGVVAGTLLLAIVLFFATEDPLLFMDLPGLGIVLVGTAAATFIAYPLREVVRVFGLIGSIVRNEKLYIDKDLEDLVNISRTWMQGDIRAVEKALEGVSNPFLRDGVQLVAIAVTVLAYEPGASRQTLGLTATDSFTIHGIADMVPGQDIEVRVTREDGSSFSFTAKSRIDTANEMEYYRNGGILHYVLRNLAAN